MGRQQHYRYAATEAESSEMFRRWRKHVGARRHEWLPVSKDTLARFIDLEALPDDEDATEMDSMLALCSQQVNSTT
jgi:hypothetical protein